MRRYKNKNKYKLIKSDNFDLKKINIGLQLLRTICSFLIVVCHIYDFDRFHHKIILGKNRYYIITFFYISFYFSYNTVVSRNIPKIKGRFKRMLIPYIIWPLLFYLNDKFNHYFYNKNEMFNYKYLYYQIITGCKIYGIFWFLFDLIFLTLFFTIIVFLFKKIFIFVLFIFTIFIYYFFYSNYANILIFNKYKKVPAHHAIRPNLEFFIFAFTGFYLSSIQFINKLYKYRILSSIVSIVSLIFYVKYYNAYFKKIIFFKGVIRDILVTFFFIIFSMLPFDKIDNVYILNVLNKITSFTGGIYYIHIKVGEFCKPRIRNVKKGNFKGCCLIYIFCYSICFLGNFIFQKSQLKFLFI